MKTVYKVFLSNNDKKVENLVKELGEDKVKVVDKGEYLDTLEVTIEDSSDIVRVFYAGLFCGMDRAIS